MARSRRREVENTDYAAFVGRIMRAQMKRVGTDGDLEGLADLAQLRRDLDAQLQQAVNNLRSAPRFASWTEIGQTLGITKQAAAKRFGGVEVEGARKGGGQPANLR